MSIDWTQTLLGSHAFHEGEADVVEAGGVAPALGAEAFSAARLAAIMAATFLLVGVIALVPTRGMAPSLPDSLAVSGVLAVEVLALALALRWGQRGLGIAAFAPLLALPFFIGAGLAPAIASAALIIACADTGLVRLRLEGAARRRHGFVALAVPAITLGLVAALDFPGWGVFGALAALALPVVLVAAQVIRAPERIATPVENRAAAALDVILARTGAKALLVDAAGTIFDTFPHTATSSPESPETAGALTDRILIADRILALRAISDAVHDHRPAEGLILRFRQAESGPLAPVRYASGRLSVVPAPGLFGRAIAIIEAAPAETSHAPVEGPRCGAAIDTALFARALHDATSPFNAGLGFLEMLSDPRLAPHDLGTYRSYAAEAHKAVAEAHRNSALVARWLKLTLARNDGRLACTEFSPGQMVQDALRAIGISEFGGEQGLSYRCEAGLPAVSMPAEAARFAVQVLMRAAIMRRPTESLALRVARDGDSLALLLLPKEPSGVSEPVEEPFQQVLQEAAASFLPVRYRMGAGGMQGVTFENVFACAGRVSGDAQQESGGSGEPEGRRLAS